MIDGLDQHERYRFPLVIDIEVVARVRKDDDAGPADTNHLGMTNIVGAAARHPDAEWAKGLVLYVAEDVLRRHHTLLVDRIRLNNPRIRSPWLDCGGPVPNHSDRSPGFGLVMV